MGGFDPIEGCRQYVRLDYLLLPLPGDGEPSQAFNYLGSLVYAVGEGFAVVVFGKVEVRANVSEIVNGWDLEALIVPNVFREELARHIVACKAEAFIVGDLCPYVWEKHMALPHCVDVAGLVSKASCDDEQVIR